MEIAPVTRGHMHAQFNPIPFSRWSICISKYHTHHDLAASRRQHRYRRFYDCSWFEWFLLPWKNQFITLGCVLRSALAFGKSGKTPQCVLEHSLRQNTQSHSLRKCSSVVNLAFGFAISKNVLLWGRNLTYCPLGSVALRTLTSSLYPMPRFSIICGVYIRSKIVKDINVQILIPRKASEPILHLL